MARRRGTRVRRAGAAILAAWGFVVVGDAGAARLAARGSVSLVGDADGRAAEGCFADVGDVDGEWSYFVIGDEDGPCHVASQDLNFSIDYGRARTRPCAMFI